jgi:hypothetical protein
MDFALKPAAVWHSLNLHSSTTQSSHVHAVHAPPARCESQGYAHEAFKLYFRDSFVNG